MIVVEIYERSSGDVVESLTVNDLADFNFYWSMQGNNEDYGWRTAHEQGN